MSFDPSELAAPGVRALHPYIPGKPISELERELGIRDVLKLASNENPLGPSPRALEVIRQELGDLALYPDGSGHELKAVLARRHNVDPACITLGNGSNDVLVLLAEAFLTPAHGAVFSQYCFAVYPIATQAAGAIAQAVPALPDDHPQMPLGHDLAAMAERIDEHTRLVFIANPNNPTGTWLPADELRQFLEQAPDHVLVVIDEAYFEYQDPAHATDASQWLEDFPRLVVSRTFSKAYGLAGLRVGYTLSHPAVADLLNRVRQPFNVNNLAMSAATAAIHDYDFINRSRELNQRSMAMSKQALSDLGFRVYPSAGNFVLVDMGGPAADWDQALLQRGIITRGVANYGLPNHLRISLGTEAQMDQVFTALTAIKDERA
ncbi:MAG: histidinol-phosphate transaminase [Wenzhouxiangellaceae bacterium]